MKQKKGVLKEGRETRELRALAEVRKFLVARLTAAEASRDKSARRKHYGEAQLDSGMASAYAFAILHVDRMVRERKRRQRS